MKQIEKLANKNLRLKEHYGLDEVDIQMLGILSQKWGKNEDVRVTDLTLKYGKTVASPANIHYRITKDLVDRKMVKLEPSPEDARVKFVIKGKAFDTLEKFIKES
jgi:DNA-binding MarR family transcriptional regulator